MRERHGYFVTVCGLNGITPARAGKTPFRHLHVFVEWDHPRSCGKDFYPQPYVGENQGSPPLVRERLQQSLCTCYPFRITPARAGKTYRRGTTDMTIRDHPRSCGKDSRWKKGSALRTRITPARAGKTFSLSSILVTFQDHPRSCGKDLCANLLFSFINGSPPLVRERLVIMH